MVPFTYQLLLLMHFLAFAAILADLMWIVLLYIVRLMQKLNTQKYTCMHRQKTMHDMDDETNFYLFSGIC